MPARQHGLATEVILKDFAPDSDPTTPGILLDLHAAIPTLKGYKARAEGQAYGPAALAAAPLGGYIALYADGTTSIIIGTATHLYRLIANVWTVADTTGPFTGVTHPWNFAQFGDDVLATNVDVTDIQVAVGAAGTFAALGSASPSNAVTIISVAGFAAAYALNEWFNSSAGTDTSWTPDVQTQAGSGFLYDYPGNIVAAVPFFRNQIIWKQAAMWLLTYIGGTQVWSSQLLSSGTGTWSQGCVIQAPEATLFLGNDDFYMTQGYAPSRIPNNFKEWFFANVAKDANGVPNYLQNTTSWYDPMNGVAYWHYVSNQATTAGVPDQYVGWNVRAQRWTHGYLETPLVIDNTQPGLTNGLYFDTSYVLQTWSATPGVMSMLTGYMGDPANLTQVLKVRPKYNTQVYPTGQAMIPHHVYQLGQSDTVDPAATLGTGGWFNTRVTDRYHRMYFATQGDCEVSSLAFEMRVSGTR